MKKTFTIYISVIFKKNKQNFISYSNNDGLKKINDLINISFKKSLKSPGTDSIKNIMKFAEIN